MPFPSKTGPRRRCALCGLPELTEVAGYGRFLFHADPDGRGPVCPPRRGCRERQLQLVLIDERERRHAS